ncbi:MAG: DJ-1/PfpI family protein [Prolixibacteraceae bacterium]|jgi:4-methyl-5(b-hydroxyethyl)-thiazole monophosphate biosynthesis|nr:DJ-1/PfpI family protein [Prolixibacteraceae bacterium]
MKSIAIHLAEGFEEIEAITIIDVLRRAEFDVVTISLTGDKYVVGAHRVTVKADQLFEETDYTAFDMIVLPGGMPGAKNLDGHAGLKQQIAAFHQQGKPLAAICAAPLVFGNMGLLKNKDAVCYPGFESYLAGAKVKYDPVAISGNIITGRGIGAALQFALTIVELFGSKDKADQLAEGMLVR